MMRSACCLLALGLATPAAAQESGIFYPAPAESSFTVARDVAYGSADTATLRMDIYRPAQRRASYPALVFYTSGAQRANPAYVGWARIAASKGLVAVLADLRPAAPAEDFRKLLVHLGEHGSEHGLDTAAIAAYGASNNAFNVFSLAQDPRETRVKALVMYYSGTDSTQPRRDLPVLWIRAGLDRPFVNASIDSAIARALARNVPVTVLNYPGGHHGFETADDNAVTRELIDQTIDFVKRATAPGYRAALLRSVGHATAASHVLAGDYSAAAAIYADLVARSPGDARLRHSLGQALLGDRQFAKACAEFGKLRGKGLPPRDLGLPAASACLQSGDPEAAMAWLASIPKRFMPRRVKDEEVFAPLRERDEFKALFEP